MLDAEQPRQLRLDKGGGGTSRHGAVCLSEAISVTTSAVSGVRALEGNVRTASNAL